MDRSELYIMMCTHAIEIQAEWKPHIGDIGFPYGLYVCHYIKSWGDKIGKLRFEALEGIGGPGWLYENETSIIWLPRQDQLVQLVADNYGNTWSLIDFFHDFIMDIKNYVLSDNVPLEQLWLCFVMYEKYGKVWNGKEWVPILICEKDEE